MYYVIVKRGNPATGAALKAKVAEAFPEGLDDEDREALNTLYKWSGSGKFTDEFIAKGHVGRIPYEGTYADIVFSGEDEGETGSDLFANISMLLNDYPTLFRDLGVEFIEAGSTYSEDRLTFEHHK